MEAINLNLSLQIIRILIVTLTTFTIAFFLYPVFIKLLKNMNLGKKVIRPEAPIFESIHKKKEGTPTFGGVIIIFSVIFVIFFYELLKNTFPNSIFSEISFLSRKETYLPLGLFLFAGLLGFIDDILGVLGIGKRRSGLRVREKLILYFIPSFLGAIWFFYKLEWDVLNIPFYGNILIKELYIPFFIFIVMSTAFATNETDGLDGLAGGILISAFVGLGIISFLKGKYDLTVFILAIIGSLMAFLWYNIYPAKIFLGDTGAMSLGVLVGIIALLTNTPLLLPFIFFIPFIESVSVILQLISKKIFKKKIFLSTPIHHHFEAIGWQETTITMKFWILSWIFAGLGVIIYLIS